MAYKFTNDQIARIRTAFEQAQASGSWKNAYELVATIVANEPDVSGSRPINFDAEVQASRLWLLGAAQVNAGEGAFSSLIRDYTARQYELHFGISLSETLGQSASDAVAEAVIDDILNTRELLAVAQIANQDATAVGEMLFTTTPNGDNYIDTAGDPEVNSAWSGSILFSFFDNGAVSADQTDRLLSSGESGTTLDSVNDLRDVLFAYDAFGAAFAPLELFIEGLGNATSEELQAFLTGQSEVSDVDVGDAMLGFRGFDFSELEAAVSEGAGGLLSLVTEDTAAGRTFAWVDHLGPETLLRSLESVVNEAEGGPFASRAHALFSQLKDTGQLDLRLQRIDRLAAGDGVEPGQPLPIDALVSAAQADTPEGKAVLFALHRGNPVVLLGRDAAETAALYAPIDTDGFLDSENFSEQYLNDRATYLSQLHVEGVDGSDAGVSDAFLLDLATDNDVGVESPLVNRRVFGGDEDDSVFGARVGASEDRLYGGRGDDILQGFGGDDRLEGQRGDDTLDGGAGHDTYAFQPGDGEDEILDSDGEGEILVDGKTLIGTDTQSEVGADGAVWEAADGTTYTLTSGSLEDGALVIEGGPLEANDRIRVEGFTNGDLGIDLNSERDLAYSFDGTTPFGGGGGPGDPELQLAESRSRTFQIFTDRPAAPGDTIRLTLDTPAAGDFVWQTANGGAVVADTPLTVDVPPGVDHVSVTLAHTGEINENLTLDVEAVYATGGGETLGTQSLPITVLDADEADDPTEGNTIFGDRAYEDVDPDTAGLQIGFDDYGNRRRTAEEVPGRDDVIFGTPASDRIEGGGGDDVLHLQDETGPSGSFDGGADIALGGTGDDAIFTGTGEDIAAGNAGSDVILGDVAGDGHDDRLYGHDQATRADAIARGNTAANVADKGDFVAGLDGDDTVIGHDARDLLTGGGGSDELIAGAGDDVILADSGVAPIGGVPSGSPFEQTEVSNWVTGHDWIAEVEQMGGPDSNAFRLDLDNVQNLDAGEAGDDVVHAGKGDDYVEAGGGRDTVHGEAGADIVFGEAGQDTIFGGNDNDLLVGDGGDAAAGEGAVDWIDGGAGDDEIFGGGGADALLGGADDDLVVGDLSDADAAADTLLGGTGDDTLIGGGAGDVLLGGDDNDILQGDADTSQVSAGSHGRDLLFGEAGDDTLFGQGGDDHLDGGDDNDTLHGDDAALDGTEHGNDVVLGGDGEDTLFGGGGDDRLDGGDDADTLVGDDSALDGQYHGSDSLRGGAGSDDLFGSGGADLLRGGEGADMLVGDGSDVDGQFHGADTLFGDGGDDLLQGGGASDRLFGGMGNDTLFGEGGSIDAQYDGDDLLDGGEGNDELIGGGGNDTLAGGGGNDDLAGDASFLAGERHGDDTLDGGGGDDEMTGGGGADVLRGGAGDDNIHGDSPFVAAEFHGADEIDGGDGADSLTGGGGNDVVRGGSGDDTLRGGTGDDTLLGGADDDQLDGDQGDDTLVGGGGADQLFGDHGNDSLAGGDGADTLSGGTGDDVVSGGAGDDLLFASAGADVLAGGAGTDTYQIDFSDEQRTVTIRDAGDNTLNLAALESVITPAPGGGFFPSVELGIGSLKLSFPNVMPNTEIHIEGFDRENPYQSAGITEYVFGNGDTLTHAELVDFFGFTFNGTGGDDTLLGTNATDRLFGDAGLHLRLAA